MRIPTSSTSPMHSNVVLYAQCIIRHVRLLLKRLIFPQATNSALLGVLLALLFILAVVIALLWGMYVNRHKGAYLTREDEGAHDAFDADTAVLQGRTGHQVEKKKEWFI